MALINKIRQHSGWAIGLIAIGLILFMVGGEIFNPNSVLFGGGPGVGKINGSKIPLKDFNERYQFAEQNFRNSRGASPNAQEQQQIRNEIWRSFVYDKVYKEEFDRLGIGVSYKEANALVRGDSMFISPQIRQMPYFKDSTGKFDRKMVEQYILTVQNDPAQAAGWKNFKDNIIRARLAEKYNTLVSKTDYVTKAEAKRAYEDQTTKTAVDYVYVPYTTIPDSSIKVTDAEMQAYANKHKDMYKAPESRSIKYVTFSIAPSKEDTAAFMTDMNTLSQNFANAKDDSTFAILETEAEVKPDFAFKSPNQMPPDLPATLEVGKVYGPYKDGANFTIVKVSDVKEDSSSFVRAKHILFKADTTMTEEVQAKVKERANEVLQKIQNGESFEKMAKIHGSDGTKDRGGDLGWYGKGQMVKPFEDATFGVVEAGLLPYLVKTQFGYHIIDVSNPKTNKRYKIAPITKALEATQESSDAVYAKIQDFVEGINSVNDFDAKVTKDPSLASKEAKRLSYNASNVNDIQEGRDIIRWAYDEKTNIGDKSGIILIGDQNLFVVAILTGKTEKDEISVDYFRDELALKVRNEKKSKMILEKLKTGGSLDNVAQSYGKGVTVTKAMSVTLAGNSLGTVPNADKAVGTAAGLKKGATSKPIVGETGVVVLKVENRTPAPDIADYSQYKKQLLNQMKMTTSYSLNQALMEIYKVEDNIGKIY